MKRGSLGDGHTNGSAEKFFKYLGKKLTDIFLSKGAMRQPQLA